MCFNVFLHCEAQIKHPEALSIRGSTEKDAVSAAGSSTSGEELLG